MTEGGEPVADGGGSGTSGSSPTRTLQIGFFFDGTGNNLDNAGGSYRGRQEGSYANARSNVALLYNLYPGGTVRNADGSELHRRGVYLEGIGTNTNGPDDLIDSALGTGNTGVSARVYAACRRLAQVAQPDRYAEVLVDAFGFSRGAAAARYFVNCINRGSFEPVQTGYLLDDEPTDLGRVALPSVTVRFVGLFDTVAAIGGRTEGSNTSNADNADVNVHLKDGSAQAICHFVAANEYRKNFASNSLRSRGGALPSGAVEILLPGAHSDVGGGYRGRGETVVPVKPEYAIFMTRSAAEACRNDLTQRYSEFSQRMLREHYAGSTPTEFSRAYDEVREESPTSYVYLGRVIWVRTDIKTGLENISLALMHERARTHGVPFRAIPQDSEHEIPREIQYIHQILQAGRELSDMDLALLRMGYIHWSCHYGHEDGDGRAAMRQIPAYTGIDFFPMEPAPNWERIVHPNLPGQAC